MDAKPIKVFIVDDHDLFRDGVKLLISSGKIAEIICEAVNGQEFLTKLEQCSPDVVLMDISMPIMDGIEASRLAHEKYPDLKIIALTMFGDEKYYYQMIQSGVKGFVLKSSGISELLSAIKEVANNKTFFSPELLLKLIDNFNNQIHSEKIQNESLQHQLSEREIEVLKLITSGLSNEEISEKLHISNTTIRTHRARIISKTGCNNTASLVMWALKNKYISVN